MKDVRPVIYSNGAPSVLIRSVGSHSTSGREKEGKKERRVRISHIDSIAYLLYGTTALEEL